jgi:hypothetical protein
MRKPLRTNSKRYKVNIKKYILDNIDVSDSNRKYENPNSENAKIHYVLDRFKSEYLHEYNLIRYKGNVSKIMAEWLSGLALNFDYYYYDIIQVSKKLHEVDEFAEKYEERIKENWWQHLANEILYLADVTAN